MLLELQTILQRLLYEHGQINSQEVDIHFEAPTRERIERLLHPTINIFLFQVQENLELRSNSYSSTRANGKAEFRLPPRRFDFIFMISMLTSEIEDEYLLLWRVLTTLVHHSEIPTELLPERMRILEIPLVTKLCHEPHSQHLSGIWGSLGTQPRPALSYTVTVPIERGIFRDAPLVLTRTARYTRNEGNVEMGVMIGGIVRNSRGEVLVGASVTIEGHATMSITDAEGKFILQRVPDEQITLLITPVDGKPHLVTIVNPVSGQDGTAVPFREIVL